MRILITGGTGLIGRALSADLAADGHGVIVLSRSPEKAQDLPAGVRTERWDAHTADGWAHLADGADAIVNLAGANLAGKRIIPRRWTMERKRIIRESRIQAGQAVVEAVKQVATKPGVVIQASGVGYYGFTGDERLDESASPGDDFLAQFAFRDWEPSTEAVEDMGVRRVIIRSGAVLDRHEGALPRLLLQHRLFVGGPIGGGKQWLSWIHLLDNVAAIRFLIERQDASGPFNLTAPEPKTNAKFSRALGRVMGRPSFVPIPAFPLRWVLGEISSVVLEGQRVVPRKLLDMGFEFRFPVAEAALKDVLGKADS
jgi:uncharacterized protein (TIGR01777 family)